LATCGFSVGGYNCPCSVCESAVDVSVDCTGAEILGPLASVANFTCIGMSWLNVTEDGSFEGAYVSPLLGLAIEFNELN
jgi:hypothetical protein